MADRLKDSVEMSAALWFLHLGENPDVTRPATFRTGACFVRLADSTGIVRISSDEPDEIRAIAKATGLSLASVYKALGDLVKVGAIDWRKSNTSVPADKSNRIRLILPRASV